MEIKSALLARVLLFRLLMLRRQMLRGLVLVLLLLPWGLLMRLLSWLCGWRGICKEDEGYDD